jgi:RNA ligase
MSEHDDSGNSDDGVNEGSKTKLPEIENLTQWIEILQRDTPQQPVRWRDYGEVKAEARDRLVLFCYTNRATFMERWNWLERQARGLILDRDSGEVVALPFAKFFNDGQGGRFNQSKLDYVMEKADGSLGILYRHQAEYHIATKGSFYSPQARWASVYLREHYQLSDLPNELTLLFEIVYPENRIIIDYGSREGLILLAARDRFTGQYLKLPALRALAERYGFELASIYDFTDTAALKLALTALDDGHEGFVAVFADGERTKFKAKRYLELAKRLTHLSFHKTLAALAAGEVERLLADIPDEFLGETKAWLEEIEATVATVKAQIEAAFAQAPKDDRRSYALWAQRQDKELLPYLFLRFDGHDLEAIIYKRAFRERKQEGVKRDFFG